MFPFLIWWCFESLKHFKILHLFACLWLPVSTDNTLSTQKNVLGRSGLSDQLFKLSQKTFQKPQEASKFRLSRNCDEHVFERLWEGLTPYTEKSSDFCSCCFMKAYLIVQVDIGTSPSPFIRNTDKNGKSPVFSIFFIMHNSWSINQVY